MMVRNINQWSNNDVGSISMSDSVVIELMAF